MQLLNAEKKIWSSSASPAGVDLLSALSATGYCSYGNAYYWWYYAYQPDFATQL